MKVVVIYSISKENGSTSADKIYYSISNRFLENQPNEICSHLTEKASKGRFLKPENGSKITVTKEKERRRRKKAMVALLIFIMSYFGYSFWPKKTVGREKGPFDDNVFKKPARYILLNICYYIRSKKCSW